MTRQAARQHTTRKFDIEPPPPPETMEAFKELIRDWHKTNYQDFADAFKAAVKKVKRIPREIRDEDEKRAKDAKICFDWRHADIETLCGFFDAWYAWEPDLKLDNGLARIQQFSWLYYENEKGRDFVMKNEAGRLMTYYFVYLKGKWMDDPESKGLVEIWLEEMKELGIPIDDYVVPKGGFQSYNQFFIRELKHKRPVSGEQDDSVVVSPADAIINMIDDDLAIDEAMNVKTQKLSVRQLLNGSRLAEKFQGGTAVSCILMPTVYHHYHSPVKGKVVEADESVGDVYFGIRDFPKLIDGGNVGYGYDYSDFESFHRGYLIIETEKYGHVGMIPVGLNTVGSVVFKDKFKFRERFGKVTPNTPVDIAKGEEVGYFQYGGSLNILLFEKGCFPAVRIPQGQIIGTLNEKAKPKAQFVF